MGDILAHYHSRRHSGGAVARQLSGVWRELVSGLAFHRPEVVKCRF